VLSLIPLILFLSCQKNSNPDEALHGLMVPTEITFEGKNYKNTGDIAAIQRLPDNVNYIGQAFLNDHMMTSVSNNISYEIYSIKGNNKNQAIAVKILLISDTESAYYYFKYERK
jgi:hypothetical protein